MLFWKISLSILIYKEILENIIFNKEILENIYINKILNQLEFCIFNRAWRRRRSRIRTIFNGKSIDKKWLIGDHLPDRLSLLLGVRDGHRHPLPLLPPGRPDLLLTLYDTLYGLGMPTDTFSLKTLKKISKTFWQFCSNPMWFQDLEMNDGSAEKPYYMSADMMRILSVKNKTKEEWEHVWSKTDISHSACCQLCCLRQELFTLDF